MRYLKILANWRIMTITMLSLASVALLTGDADGLFELAAIKSSGLLFAYLLVMLSKAWRDKMPELDIFSDD